MSRNDPETPTIDPERDFIDTEKNVGLPEVGRNRQGCAKSRDRNFR